MRFALPILLMACILMIQCAAAYAQERGLPPGSGLYYKWLKGCVNGVEEDIPSITASASAAAAKFVLEDFQIGAWGDTAFISEFTGRAGGLMPVTPVSDKDTALAGRIILVPLDDDSLAERIARIAAFKAQGNMVIVFGRKSVLQEANKLGGAWDFAVENHAAPHGGLLKGEDGKWYVPTDGTANIVALWAWTGEFVGACRRLGKMPAMWQSIGVPGSKERNDRYRKLRYDEGVFVTPSAPGVVGRGYMRALRIGLGNVFEKESPAIQKASGALVSALKGNCNLYLLPLGHALSAQKDGGNCDPGFFKHWSAKNSVAGKGDVLLCISYAGVCNVDAARNAGALFVWSFTDYSPDAVRSIPAGDIWINQHWEMGDAIVPVPGYDVKVLPSSGVIDEALFWMMNADLFLASGKSSSAVNQAK